MSGAQRAAEMRADCFQADVAAEVAINSGGDRRQTGRPGDRLGWLATGRSGAAAGTAAVSGLHTPLAGCRLTEDTCQTLRGTRTIRHFVIDNSACRPDT